MRIDPSILQSILPFRIEIFIPFILRGHSRVAAFYLLGLIVIL